MQATVAQTSRDFAMLLLDENPMMRGLPSARDTRGDNIFAQAHANPAVAAILASQHKLVQQQHQQHPQPSMLPPPLPNLTQLGMHLLPGSPLSLLLPPADNTAPSTATTCCGASKSTGSRSSGDTSCSRIDPNDPHEQAIRECFVEAFELEARYQQQQRLLKQGEHSIIRKQLEQQLKQTAQQQQMPGSSGQELLFSTRDKLGGQFLYDARFGASDPSTSPPASPAMPPAMSPRMSPSPALPAPAALAAAAGAQSTCAGCAALSAVVGEHPKTLDACSLTEMDEAASWQVVADLMVWAEITQPHYDPSIQSFVLQAQKDEGFWRVGHYFRQAKAKRGVH